MTLFRLLAILDSAFPSSLAGVSHRDLSVVIYHTLFSHSEEQFY